MFYLKIFLQANFVHFKAKSSVMIFEGWNHMFFGERKCISSVSDYWTRTLNVSQFQDKILPSLHLKLCAQESRYSHIFQAFYFKIISIQDDLSN